MYKMKTIVKKTMGLLMATLVAFGVMTGTTQAFAAENQLEYKVNSQLSVSGSLFSKKVTGTVDVSKTVTATPVTPIEGQVVPELLRTLVFARPCGGDQFAAGTVSPSLDMSR